MGIIKYFDPQLVEKARLKSGLVRVSRVVRSESFKRNYRDWKNSQLFHHTFQQFQAAYEASFYDENPEIIQIEKNNFSNNITFHNLTNIQSSEPSFLIDFLKEKLIDTDLLQKYKSATWRRMIPDVGMEICERYILTKKMPFWKRILPFRFLETDIIVVEMLMMEFQYVDFSIKHYPSEKMPLFRNIDHLMEELID